MDEGGRDDDTSTELLEHDEEKVELVGHVLVQQDRAEHAC